VEIPDFLSITNKRLQNAKQREKMMKRHLLRFMAITLVLMLPLLSSCFKFLQLDQASTAQVGDKIQTYLEVRTAGTDQNPHYGIVGLLLPNGWTVDSVYFSGDYGPDYGTFLHPDSIDGDPGGQVDYWADSLEFHFPSGDDMQWLVYQSTNSYTADLDTAFFDLFVEMTVGSQPGKYNIGYLVTNAALDFSDPSFYEISLENPIEVTGESSVPAQAKTNLPDFALAQNYPNPFNPTTNIHYVLPEAGLVRLTVYNLLGGEMATLVNGMQPAGAHEIDFNASNFASGVYYYRLESSNQQVTRKMILIR
jgi:hypothetical protein